MSWHDTPLTQEAEKRWQEKNDQITSAKKNRKAESSKPRKPRVEHPVWPHPASSRKIIEKALRAAGSSGLLCGQIYQALNRGDKVARQALKTMVDLGHVRVEGKRGVGQSTTQFSYIWNDDSNGIHGNLPYQDQFIQERGLQGPSAGDKR